MEQVSSFYKGLNKDFTKAAIPDGFYRDARNIRIVTAGGVTGDSTAAVTNADGNVILTSIPDTGNVVKLIVIAPVIPSNSPIFPQIFTASINQRYISSTVNSYQEIADLINNDPILSSFAVNIKAAATSTFVLIWGAVTGTTIPSPTINAQSFSFMHTFTNLVPQQTGLKIMGWGLIRDEIILFTTASTDQDPGGADPSSVGQIWRLTYDKVTLVPTLALLYNNYLDFTTFHSFREEGQSEGRYENSDTKNIYWTENFNVLRRFNTADPNGFALDPTLLDSRPPIDFDVPILQKVNDRGGILHEGMYQATYRLKNFGGAATVYSKGSNLVPVLSPVETDPFIDIVDAAAITSKSITWNIDNIDTDFERIEIVILYRYPRNAVPIIDQVFDEPIPSSGNFTFTYTGDETPTPVSLNDFLDITSAFTHCKSITSKDNILLAANTRNKTFDVDYDARAYRFNSATINRKARIQSSQGTSIIDILAANVQGTYPSLTPAAVAEWTQISETHDAVNPDQFDQTVNGYRFQSDGVTLGGEGPNIKYTFEMKYFQSDWWTTGNGFTATSNDPAYGPVGRGSREAPRQPANFSLNNNTFSNNNMYEGFKSWYLASAFKGYQHDEVYAFAIQFFDKQGRPGFAKWIADIRMPLVYEALDLSNNSFQTFPFSGMGAPFAWSNWQGVGVLFPKFDVHIPTNLLDKIGGWEIVRCERTTNDKSVMAAGSIHPVSSDSTNFYAQCPGQDTLVSGHVSHVGDLYTDMDALTGNEFTASQGLVQDKIVGFKSPEFTFLQFPGYAPGDKIKIVAILQHKFDMTAVHSSYNGRFYLHKNYTLGQPNVGASNVGINNERILTEAFHLSKNGSGTLTTTTSTPILNRSATLNNTNNEPGTIGDSVVILNFHLDYILPLFSGASYIHKYYALYYRPKSAQYGGNSYSQRTNRKYISTGQYQEITNTSSTNYQVQIFGGDIYTNIWDFQQGLINYDGDAFAPGASLTSDRRYSTSTTHFFPVQTVLNTEWRYGSHVNRTGMNNNGTGVDLGEDYLENSVFSTEDNVRYSFPKPINFRDIQENDNRIYASGFKLNGEPIDSWGIFAPFDFEDVNGQYGPINNLQILKDNVFGLQDKGVFYIPINQQELINSNSGSSLKLGTGEKLGKPIYLTSTGGCKHQFGNINTEKGIYYFDIDNLKLNRITSINEEVSVIAGLDSYFKNNLKGLIRKTDKPNYNYGIIATHDQNNHDVLFTFHDIVAISKQNLTSVQDTNPNSETLAFNELTQSFTSYYDYFPSLYINDKTHVLTTYRSTINTTLSDLWMQGTGNPGQFCNIQYPSSLQFLIAFKLKEVTTENFAFVTEVKDLNGIEINGETFNEIRVSNNYQNSDYIPLIVGTNLKKEKRNWQLSCPRTAVIQTIPNPDIFLAANLNQAQLFKAKFKGQWIMVDLKFPNIINNSFKKLILAKISTLFSFNHR